MHVHCISNLKKHEILCNNKMYNHFNTALTTYNHATFHTF